MKIPWYRRIYALYKGEQYITDGTIYEISRKTDKSLNFSENMTYPIYEKFKI